MSHLNLHPGEKAAFLYVRAILGPRKRCPVPSRKESEDNSSKWIQARLSPSSLLFVTHCCFCTQN